MWHKLLGKSSRRLDTRSHALRVRQFFRPLLEQFEDRRLLATVTVNTTSDVSDGTTTSIAALIAAPGADGFISLRESILAANNTANVDGPDADSDPDPDAIHFNIAGAGVKTITPTSGLPTISEAVVIDGYSQPGASANTLAVGSDAVLLIEINGSSNGGRSGIVLGGVGGSTVRGLVINRSGGILGSDAGIFIASSNNVVAGNFVGTDAAGAAPLGNPFGGIRISSGDNNLIGGTTPAARNLISGNRGSGNVVVGNGFTRPTGTIIRGNYIGTNAAGMAAITTNQNLTATGVRVINSANTTIGGADLDDGAEDGQVGARNLISGNSFAGIHIEKQSGTWVRAIDGVTIAGNFIGVNASGVAAIRNLGAGIRANEGLDTFNLVVGGTARGAGNVISGNTESGFIGGGFTMTMQGNFVGTDLSGTLDLGNGIDGSAGQGNGGEGVHVSMGGNEGPNFQITVGGTTPAARNIISGNAANGVLVTGLRSGSVTVQGNYIGTQADGQTPLPNQFSGIEMNRNLVIGGIVAGAGNVIAFNAGRGVFAPTQSNSPFLAMPILGNTIFSNGPNTAGSQLGLGIDMQPTGVSQNDPSGDPVGVNNAQNFPVVTGVAAANGNTVVTARLSSAASTMFRIELFSTDVSDPSGHGEGPTLLQAKNVMTDGTGIVNFTFDPMPSIIPAGRFLTATATRLDVNGVPLFTSEFSLARPSLIVTNTNDTGIGALRTAITLANSFVNVDGPDANTVADPDAITFAIPGAGVHTITPATELPTIIEAVSIDGYTQAGAQANTLAVGSDAVLLIELNGASVVSGLGLTLGGTLGGSTVRGLAVNRFSDTAITLFSRDNVVEGNFVGLAPDGTTERANGNSGVRVASGQNNLIGGTRPQARNVISGYSSGSAGQIYVARSPTGFLPIGTLIRGNYIGTNAAGTAAVHPSSSNKSGIRIDSGNGTIIGGSDADDGTTDGIVQSRNVISGNLNGISLQPQTPGQIHIDGLTIQGNFIGVDATGTTAVGNFGAGISAGNPTSSHTLRIGGTAPGAANVIAGNLDDGFVGGSVFMVIEGNRVGTDLSGTLDLGNGGDGIHVSLGSNISSFQITVGGTTPASRNVISGNTDNGVLVTGRQGNQGDILAVQGNFIGTQADGISPLPNGANGIQMDRNVTVGGTAAGTGNVIAFNGRAGVSLPVPSDGLSFVVPIRGNSIYSNGPIGNSQSFLGIDLRADGVTANDPGDADGGVNFLQNFPEIAAATFDAGTLTVEYKVPTLSFTADYPLRIEFFKADADGQEGQTFLGFDTYLSSQANTTKTISFMPAAGSGLAIGDRIVGTATDNSSRSSEFSASQIVASAVPVNQPPTIASNGGGDTATIAVPENTTAVTTVMATDPDAGTTLTYSIVGGTDSGRFSINTTSGALAFATAPNFEAPTDADTNNSYLVIVQASDGSLTDSQTLTVTVANVNEPPVIASNGGGDSAGVSVPENTTAVTTVTAMDADAGTTIVYSISGGADAAQFAIDPSSGALTFIAAPNFEAPTDAGGDNVYDVVVAASDGSAVDTQAIAVNVLNANEPTVITSNGGGDTATIVVPENTTAVTTVAATDPDAGTTLTYSIIGGADLSRFSINSTSGELVFATAPNFEAPTDADANNSYLVIVQAGDSSFTDSQTLTVTIMDANEPPVIASNGGGDSASISVPENTTAVTTVSASDPDAGGILTYSIVGGADAGKFTINDMSGDLAFATAPNFETPTDADANNSYLVVVQAIDGSLTDSQTLTVTVTNANEPPAITSNGGGDTATIAVSENTTAVTTVTANDSDAGTTLTYSIVGGADLGKFSINAVSGDLAFTTAPNFEAPTDTDLNNSYLVVVQVSDGSLTDLQTLTVTVTDANEPPEITSNGGGDSAGVSVPENTTAVTTVMATDPDAGTAPTYSIAGGADAGEFSINASTGELAFTTAPNFEAPTDTDLNNSYVVIVQASDGSLTDTQTLTVTVTNANEPSKITSNGGGDAASVNVPENTTAVTTVTATDPDAGTTIGYSISGGADAAKFAIHPSSGALAFIAAPNFEAPADADADNVYDVVVAASDGSLTDSQTLTVTVTNVNEAPVITSDGGGNTATKSVAENSTAVTTVTATDPDQPPQTLTFAVAGGADAARFTINSSTGVLSFVSAPNFENPTDANSNNVYEVIVQASDGSLADSQAINVTVTDVNEQAPPGLCNGSVVLTNGLLTIRGTDGDDHVSINKQGNGLLKVHADFFAEGNFKTFPLGGIDRIRVVLCNGNDHATVSGQVQISALLDGGEGGDHLNGGGGHNILVGGGGDDMLIGGATRDLLIGGREGDRLVGNGGDDLLIAGATAFDANYDALDAIMAEWASNCSYAVRVANLMGQPGSSFAKRLNGNYFLKTNGPNITVFDDGQSDKLTGSSGRDWIFADLDGGIRDTITDRKCGERVDDVDA